MDKNKTKTCLNKEKLFEKKLKNDVLTADLPVIVTESYLIIFDVKNKHILLFS